MVVCASVHISTIHILHRWWECSGVGCIRVNLPVPRGAELVSGCTCCHEGEESCASAVTLEGSPELSISGLLSASDVHVGSEQKDCDQAVVDFAIGFG